MPSSYSRQSGSRTELRERKGRSGMARISKTKIDALKLVEAGRIEYGAEYPNLARRSGSSALDASFLVAARKALLLIGFPIDSPA